MSRPNARQLDAIRWLPCTGQVDSDASPIPAFGCVQVLGTVVTGGIASLQVTQPIGTSGPFAFNGAFAITCCAGGSCTQDYPCVALYDSGTPAVGETWLPRAGQYTLTKGTAGAAGGFIVEGIIDVANRTMWVAPGSSASATTATTATTSSPSTTLPPCVGSCRWVWSAENNAWSLGLGVDNCSNPTTTSTSTTSTTTTTGDPSTTTTPNPCPCNTTTTGDPATSTTSTSTSTPMPCRCIYPSYCGTTDGECTSTYCASGIVAPQVHCTTSTTTSSTTSSSTTSTTSTTCGCDCATTTTSTSDGSSTSTSSTSSSTSSTAAATSTTSCSGCTWVGLPNGLWGIVSNGCQCSTCPAPGVAPSGVCDSANTDCIPTTPAPLPPPSQCGGVCVWWWIPALSQWALASSTCGGGTTGCSCVQPSAAGSDCTSVSTPCQAPPAGSGGGGTGTTPPGGSASSTSSTTATTGTTQPCACCYSTTPETTSTTETTTSSTTTSTTTTCGACNCGCMWAWIGGSWVVTANGCDDVTCSCAQPPNAGSGACDVETAHSPCGPTSTTTSTTTTCNPCDYVCQVAAGNFVDYWTSFVGTGNAAFFYDSIYSEWVYVASDPACVSYSSAACGGGGDLGTNTCGSECITSCSTTTSTTTTCAPGGCDVQCVPPDGYTLEETSESNPGTMVLQYNTCIAPCACNSYALSQVGVPCWAGHLVSTSGVCQPDTTTTASP